MEKLTPKELLQRRKLNRYSNWLLGQEHRINNQHPEGTNGDYLNGWYSPDAIMPDFLLPSEVVELKNLIKKK